jgi:hypothetical protein
MSERKGRLLWLMYYVAMGALTLWWVSIVVRCL